MHLMWEGEEKKNMAQIFGLSNWVGSLFKMGTIVRSRFGVELKSHILMLLNLDAYEICQERWQVIRYTWHLSGVSSLMPTTINHLKYPPCSSL